MLEMAKRILRKSAHPVQQRRIWIDRETRIGGTERFILAAQNEEVIALRIVRQIAIGGERDRTLGLTEYFCVVIDLRACPSQLFLVEMGYGVAGQCRDIVGVDLERLLESGSRRIIVVFGKRLQLEQGIPAHREIEDIGVFGTRASFGFRLDELETQSIGQSRHHLILQLEQVGDVFLKAFGPEMGARFGVDELRVDANPILVALDRAFEHIANAELPADLRRRRACPCK